MIGGFKKGDILIGGLKKKQTFDWWIFSFCEYLNCVMLSMCLFLLAVDLSIIYGIVLYLGLVSDVQFIQTRRKNW